MSPDPLKCLESRFLIVDGYWISPAMIAEETPTILVLTNGKRIAK